MKSVTNGEHTQELAKLRRHASQAHFAKMHCGYIHFGNIHFGKIHFENTPWKNEQKKCKSAKVQINGYCFSIFLI